MSKTKTEVKGERAELRQALYAAVHKLDEAAGFAAASGNQSFANRMAGAATIARQSLNDTIGA